MAICLGEPDGPECMQALQLASGLLISAGTLTEAIIVADGRGRQREHIAPAAEWRLRCHRRGWNRVVPKGASQRLAASVSWSGR